MFRTLRHFPGAFLAGALFSLILTGVYFLVLAPERSFPVLPDGQYIGQITWQKKDGLELPNTFMIKKYGEEYKLLLPNPSQKTNHGTFLPLRNAEDARYLPIQMSTGASHFLWFSEAEWGPQEAPSVRGDIFEIKSGTLGSWMLTEVASSTRAAENEFDDKTLLLQASLVVEGHMLSEELEHAQISLQSFAEEVDALAERVLDVDTLRATGIKRLEELMTQLEHQKVQLEEESKELQQEAEKLFFARSVQEYGEVIGVSRKLRSLEERYILAEGGGYLSLSLPQDASGSMDSNLSERSDSSHLHSEDSR
ncbi:MAG: hypothetical protein ACO3XO_02630 [Bdellovibrionota bacterium]|jgi:hypothetical protein